MGQTGLSVPLIMSRPLPFASNRIGLHRYTLLAGLLIAFAGLVILIAPTDPDVWWHLRTGQLILDQGIPTRDVYSFTALGRPWLVQEWLTEIVMQAVKSVFGYGVLSLLFGFLQAMGTLVVYLLLRQRGAGRLVALLLLMLYVAFAAPSWGVRPQVLIAIFLGGFYLILLRYKDDPSRVRLLWLLPPLMVLWTNMHASYFMGIALIGVVIVGELANNFLYRPARPAPLRPLFLSLAACLLATLLNPYFIELWAYPLTYALNGTSNPLLRYTQEWQSPDFHQPTNLLFGLSLVLLALVGVARPVGSTERATWRIAFTRRVDFTDGLILTLFTLLALQAVRLVPIYGVMALPVLANGLAHTWPALSRSTDNAPSRIESRLNTALGVVGIIAIAFLLARLPQAQTGSEPRTDTSVTYPAQGADYISRLGPDVRLYNNFAWGGYLIYRLYPQHLVFIDGRADMYREGVFDDFITVQNVASPWRQVLARYGVNLVIISPGSPLDNVLAHEPGWAVASKDSVSVIYRKGK